MKNKIGMVEAIIKLTGYQIMFALPIVLLLHVFSSVLGSKPPVITQFNIAPIAISVIFAAYYFGVTTERGYPGLLDERYIKKISRNYNIVNFIFSLIIAFLSIVLSATAHNQNIGFFGFMIMISFSLVCSIIFYFLTTIPMQVAVRRSASVKNNAKI